MTFKPVDIVGLFEPQISGLDTGTCDGSLRLRMAPRNGYGMLWLWRKNIKLENQRTGENWDCFVTFGIQSSQKIVRLCVWIFVQLVHVFFWKEYRWGHFLRSWRIWVAHSLQPPQRKLLLPGRAQASAESAAAGSHRAQAWEISTKKLGKWRILQPCLMVIKCNWH